TDPSGLTVTVEGRDYNTDLVKEVPLSPGAYSVLLSKTGYVSKQVPVEITDQKISMLAAKLDSASPVLRLNEFADAFMNLSHWENPAGWRADGVLHARGAGTVLLKDKPFKNFTEHFKLKLTSGACAGLVLRARDARNFYLVQITGEGYWNSS